MSESDTTGPTVTTLVWDLPLRLWHWALALTLAGSLYTGLSGDVSLMDRHLQFGYGVLGLLLFRIGWGFWGGRYARFSRYGVTPGAVIAHFRGGGRADPHTAPGRLLAVVLLGLVATQAGTGLFATDDIFTEGPLNGYVSAGVAKTLTWVHHRVFWLVIAAIAVHLLAHVVYAALRDPTPLAMFTGRKPLALTPAEPRLAAGALTAALAAAAVWAFLAAV